MHCTFASSEISPVLGRSVLSPVSSIAGVTDARRDLKKFKLKAIVCFCTVSNPDFG